MQVYSNVHFRGTGFTLNNSNPGQVALLQSLNAPQFDSFTLSAGRQIQKAPGVQPKFAGSRLMDAVNAGDYGKVEKILQDDEHEFHMLDKQRGWSGDTAVSKAIKNGRNDIARLLVSHGASLQYNGKSSVVDLDPKLGKELVEIRRKYVSYGTDYDGYNSDDASRV